MDEPNKFNIAFSLSTPFSNKEEYMDWVQNWKYHLRYVESYIRFLKRNRKATAVAKTEFENWKKMRIVDCAYNLLSVNNKRKDLEEKIQTFNRSFVDFDLWNTYTRQSEHSKRLCEWREIANRMFRTRGRNKLISRYVGTIGGPSGASKS